MARSVSSKQGSCVAATVVVSLLTLFWLSGPGMQKGLAEQRAGRKKPANLSAASAADLAAVLTPTFTDVKYGPHTRNVLDFWLAKSAKPTPAVAFIHGGGFTAGDKSKIRGDRLVQKCLDAGVSFAAINYRYRTDTPIQDVLRDCARAIQFIRWKAAEWNVDKARVASYGGSAGAGTSLWRQEITRGNVFAHRTVLYEGEPYDIADL